MPHGERANDGTANTGPSNYQPGSAVAAPATRTATDARTRGDNLKIRYQQLNLRPDSLKIVAEANAILSEYARRGIVVTLRQLYYQFVARDIIPNRQSEYKRLGSIVNDARLAGLIDWNYLQDRTRNLNSLSHWDNPAGIIESAAQSYHRNLWAGQGNYVEVWIEKDALIGVIESVCQEFDVPYFSCRGYTSQSEMWGAGQRLLTHARDRQHVHIVHLGDHDPSGKDMSRDIADRLREFMTHHLIRDFMRGQKLEEEEPAKEKQIQACDAAVIPFLPQIDRVALNMDQVEQYNPPPNPAKITDSRAGAYIEEFGAESWELDALDPDVLTDLIRGAIESRLDRALWTEQKEQQERERAILTKTSRNWARVATFVERLK
jgi:hypothetical protein